MGNKSSSNPSSRRGSVETLVGSIVSGPSTESIKKPAGENILSEFAKDTDFAPWANNFIDKREKAHIKIKNHMPEDPQLLTFVEIHKKFETFVENPQDYKASDINKVINDAICRSIITVSKGANFDGVCFFQESTGQQLPGLDISTAKTATDLFSVFSREIEKMKKTPSNKPPYNVVISKYGLNFTGPFTVRHFESIVFLLLQVIANWKGVNINLYFTPDQKFAPSGYTGINPPGNLFSTNITTQAVQKNQIYARIIETTPMDSLITELANTRRRFDTEDFLFAGNSVLAQASFYSVLWKQKDFLQSTHACMTVPFFKREESFNMYLVDIILSKTMVKLPRRNDATDKTYQLVGKRDETKNAYEFPDYKKSSPGLTVFGSINVSTLKKNKKKHTITETTGKVLLPYIIFGWSKEISTFNFDQRKVFRVELNSRPQDVSDLNKIVEDLNEKLSNYMKATIYQTVSLEGVVNSSQGPTIDNESFRILFSSIEILLLSKGLRVAYGENLSKWLTSSCDIFFSGDTKELLMANIARSPLEETNGMVKEFFGDKNKTSCNLTISRRSSKASKDDKGLVIPFSQVCEIRQLPRSFPRLYRLLFESGLYGETKFIYNQNVAGFISNSQNTAEHPGVIDLIKRIE